jgi:hypothetical protein
MWLRRRGASRNNRDNRVMKRLNNCAAAFFSIRQRKSSCDRRCASIHTQNRAPGHIRNRSRPSTRLSVRRLAWTRFRYCRRSVQGSIRAVPTSGVHLLSEQSLATVVLLAAEELSWILDPYGLVLVVVRPGSTHRAAAATVFTYLPECAQNAALKTQRYQTKPK